VKSFGVERPTHSHQKRGVVDGIPRSELVQVPQPLLPKRKRSRLLGGAALDGETGFGPGRTLHES
jgi:hypothetical protein